MIYKCLSCGHVFHRDAAISELYPGGEHEYFCPVCGSDDIEEVNDETE